MNMNFYMPVTIKTGKGCVTSEAEVFRALGKRCLIVTGKHGAKASGALDDLISVLTREEIVYSVYDRIEQNPSFDACLEAAVEAQSTRAEFIVGIGGGSPLDAAKAIAVLAAAAAPSEDMLFSGKWDAAPLPIVAIGTTAGTGSEVTPVSVITKRNGRKTSFRAPSLYPRVAFGDATYTMSLSPDFTRSTALDALAHCLESYFNRTANELSRTFAERGIAILAAMLRRTAECESVPLSFEEREALYAASLYGGLAIGVTGTAFPHALGYFLSEQHGIPHGNACAVYLEEFIRYNAEAAPDESAALFAALGITSGELITLIKQNLPAPRVELTEEKITELGPRFENNKSLNKCYGTADRAFAEELLRRLFMEESQ